MIPQISGGIVGSIETVAFPSNTYRLTEDQIVGDIDGIEAIKQAVFHILSTERYAYAIYENNYGSELEKYLGRSFSYLEATIQDTLRDALLQDDRITAVNVTSVTKTKKDSALILFTVISDRGSFNMEVDVNF